MKRNSYRSFSRAVSVATLMLALPVLAAAQNVTAWFSKPANATAYGSIAAEVESLGASIRAAALSDSLIAKRLEEGAQKHVSSAILLATLKADAERALSVAKALGSRGLISADPKKATFAVEQTTLLLRAGIDETELGATLDASVRKLGRGNAAVSRALAALSVTATAKSKYDLSGNEGIFLAVGLVTSDLSEGKLNSILSSIANLLKSGSSVSEALEVAIEKTSKGNSAVAKAAAASAEKSDVGKSGNKKSKGNEGESGGNGNSGNSNKSNSSGVRQGK